jgi:DNA-binding transcriptional LysR family regulator
VLAFVAGATPAKWVDTWKTRMPGVPIEVRPMAEVEVAERVLSGEVNVALVRLPIERAGLDVIPLYEEQPVVVAPKDHPIAAYASVSQAELEGETIIEGQDAATVELVSTGMGVAVMPHSLARLHSRKDVVARVVSDLPVTQIALIWRHDDESPEVEQFIGIVRGRTANSSRGAREEPETPAATGKPVPVRPTHQKRASHAKQPRRRRPR